MGRNLGKKPGKPFQTKEQHVLTCKDSVVRGTKWRPGKGEGREPMWGEWDKVVGRVSKITLKITLAAVGTDGRGTWPSLSP